MDLLRSALQERQAKAQKVIADTGKKWIRRGELEQRRQEEYFEDLRREQEKTQADEEDRWRRLDDHLTKKTLSGSVAVEEEVQAAPVIDDALLDDDDAEPPVGVEEVIDRLREMLQPITLFGETNMQRYKRLRKLEKESHEGKKNPDMLMLEQHQHEVQRQEEVKAAALAAAYQAKENAGNVGTDQEEEEKSEAEEEEAEEEEEDQEEEREEAKAEQTNQQVGGEGVVPERPQEPPEEAEEEKQVATEIMDKCDAIRSWVRKSLKAWEKELAERGDDEKSKAATKVEMAQHRQARRDVRPLQKRLRVYRLDDFMLEKVGNIVELAAAREYRQASEAYLDLSIGRAAWPVGIGCGGSMLMEDAIGLHDKFNRNNQVKDIAFALNDDVARKYVQALKRLMTVAQRYWPADDPSKAST